MGKFAFIIHPLEARDVARKLKFARSFSDGMVESMTRFLPALPVSRIQGVRSAHGTTEGWFVACPLTSKQMLTMHPSYVIKRIIQAGRLAQRMGAEIIGLGAMTSVVGDGGIMVAKNLSVPVTSGNSYTVAMAMEGTLEASRLMGTDLKKAKVMVLGATGSIGSVCAQLLARHVNDLTLVARDPAKLDRLANRIMFDTGLSVKVTVDAKRSIQQADVVVAVTSAVESIIQPEDLKPGAVVCDVARPRDVSRRVAEERNDVLVIEGGIVEVPGDVDFNFNFGFPPKTAYVCMAETMILAMEGRKENYSLGRDLSIAQVEEIKALGKKHGFKLAGFRSFERAVPMEEIQAIRERARQKLESLPLTAGL